MMSRQLVAKKTLIRSLYCDLTPVTLGGIHQCSVLFKHCFGACVNNCQKAAYEVNSLAADFLAINTQRLVNAKYWSSQILPCVYVYPARREIRAEFQFLTG
jgi:hypothetical protein